MSLIPGSDYAGGGVLPGYQNPVPTQENMKKSRRRTTSPYSSVTQVQAAYKNGEISYNQAYIILTTQFAMSDGDATDILTVEVASCEGEYVPPIGPEQRPGDFDGDGIPNEQDCDHYVVQENDTNTDDDDDDDDDSRPSIPMTADQRFLLIGALVIAIGSRMIIKKD
jgi:hypothetical protein